MPCPWLSFVAQGGKPQPSQHSNFHMAISLSRRSHRAGMGHLKTRCSETTMETTWERLFWKEIFKEQWCAELFSDKNGWNLWIYCACARSFCFVSRYLRWVSGHVSWSIQRGHIIGTSWTAVSMLKSFLIPWFYANSACFVCETPIVSGKNNDFWLYIPTIIFMHTYIYIYIYTCMIRTHMYDTYIYYTVHAMPCHAILYHYIASHCIPLHYTALHCIALHYIT